jgi:hypothetical protein
MAVFRSKPPLQQESVRLMVRPDRRQLPDRRRVVCGGRRATDLHDECLAYPTGAPITTNPHGPGRRSCDLEGDLATRLASNRERRLSTAESFEI